MIKIRLRDLENIISHCLDEEPIEACGILAGKIRDRDRGVEKEVQKVYNCRNELISPTEYKIEADEQFKIFSEIEDISLDLIGFYHSHLNTSSEPSSIDRERANYYGYSYLIVSLVTLKVCSWVLEERGVFKEEEICINE